MWVILGYMGLRMVCDHDGVVVETSRDGEVGRQQLTNPRIDSRYKCCGILAVCFQLIQYVLLGSKNCRVDKLQKQAHHGCASKEGGFCMSNQHCTRPHAYGLIGSLPESRYMQAHMRVIEDSS